VIYKAPEEDMRDFLAERMSLLSGFERLESIEFAKALIDSKEGGERPKVITICKHFSWLKKIGVLDYERVMGKCGGMRLLLFRSCTASDAVKIISGHEDHAPEKNEEAPDRKKERERCCSNYKPVRSKKTGRRRCKSCGAELPDRKVRNG